MQGSTTDRTSTGYVAIHPLDPEDAAITASMRAMVSSSKGARPGIEARGQFDALMESVLPRGDVTFEADTLGGVPGLWVHPADWRSGEAIVHLHERVLGRTDATDSAEVARTFKLFAGIVKDASEQKGLDKRESYYCRPANRDAPNPASDDPHYTIRAWRGVVTYLLRRSEFLYE